MNINTNDFKDIDPGDRVLMGPGPSNVSARVLQAMSAPCIGHLDPYFLLIMDETQRLLKYLFQTENPTCSKQKIHLPYQFPAQAAQEWKPVSST